MCKQSMHSVRRKRPGKQVKRFATGKLNGASTGIW
jgi:hypothetical protein